MTVDRNLIIKYRMTEVQRDTIVSPPDGLMIYQTNGTTGIYARVSGAWKLL